jgi:hypothetical protein
LRGHAFAGSFDQSSGRKQAVKRCTVADGEHTGRRDDDTDGRGIR